MLPGGQYARGWEGFYHGLDGLNGLDGWDLFPFPRLTPLQPDGDVHPYKQACLPEPFHLSGLPLSDGKKSIHGYNPMISLCLEGSTPQDGKRFIPVYRLGEDGDLLKEGGGMLSVWALRARSYKTRAEA